MSNRAWPSPAVGVLILALPCLPHLPLLPQLHDKVRQQIFHGETSQPQPRMLAERTAGSSSEGEDGSRPAARRETPGSNGNGSSKNGALQQQSSPSS